MNNRIETILKLSDQAQKMKSDELHIFLIKVLKRLSDSDLMVVELENEVEEAKQL